jgi:hypothetical protein
VVRKVFASSIDLVIHLDRRTNPADQTMQRQTMEIRAVVPSLHDSFSSEPLFARERIGSPLAWTGASPPGDLSEQIERALPSGITVSSLLERGMQW